MKTKFLLSTLLMLASLNGLAAGTLVNTDTSGVLHSGAVHESSVQTTSLAPGLYEIADINSPFWGDHYQLIVQTYVNDPSKSIAILFPRGAVDHHHSKAWLYEGRSIKNGTEVMLSPLAIDDSGNLRVTSEGQKDAPVIEVSLRDGTNSYPYILRGRNGALDGKLFGMRGSSSVTPLLRDRPSNGIFAAASSSSDVNLLVNGSEVSVNDGSLSDQTFDMVALNGEQGGFAALTQSRLDTMAETEVADEQIRRIATFVDNCFADETFMILTQTANWGEYSLDSYELTTPSILDFLFPGRTTPINSNLNVNTVDTMNP